MVKIDIEFFNNEYVMKSKWFPGEGLHEGCVCMHTPEGDSCVILEPNMWFNKEIKQRILQEICDNHNSNL